jgi:hypothetical protein
MACGAATGAVLAFLLVGTAGCAVDTAATTGTFDQAIIGGSSTEPGEYPATGALVRGLTYRCTATLIAPDVAVTAAHCLEGEGWGDFGFTLDPDLTVDITDIIPALVTHQHPDFHPEGSEYLRIGKRNDVGVVILEEPILNVQPEKLDEWDQVTSLESGSELLLCGYGRDEWAVSRTAGLKRDAVVYVDVATSWEVQSIGEDPQPCKGDSGGPLFVETPNGRRIAGLVSRAAGGSHMCDTGAIYTRVATYTDWIREASLDRDTGCSAGQRGGKALWAWPALLSCLVMRRRRSTRR